MRRGQIKFSVILGLIMTLAVNTAFARTVDRDRDGALSYKALMLTQTQAKAGDADAQFALYDVYGAKEDYAQAYEWLEKAADQGHMAALFWSFMRYDSGGNFSMYRSPVNYTKAFHRLKQMEAIEPSSAWFNLGFYYRYGRGVKRDYALAAHYFTQCTESAERGCGFYSDAQIELGDMYSKGLGVRQDDVSAYVWYSLGVEQKLAYRHTPLPQGTIIDCAGRCPAGTPDEAYIKRRDELRRRLAPMQKRDAEQRVKAFRDRHPVQKNSYDPPIVNVTPPPSIPVP